MDQTATRGLLLPPAVLDVRLTQGRHIGRSAAVFRQRQAIEMAAIACRPAVDERRLPLGHKAPVALDRHQSVEQGVHEPEAIAAPGQVVPHQRAAVVAAAGQKGDVVLTLRLDPGCDLPVGGQGPDGVSSSNSNAGRRTAEPHRLIEMGEADAQLLLMAAHAHHPPGLVGGKQHRELQALQQGRQAAGELIGDGDTGAFLAV